jgi:hypothetical protein
LAGEIVVHRLVRNIHLSLGLASVLFVLTYAVSAVQMAHRIRLVPRVSEEDLRLPPGLTPRSLAAALRQARGYGGELGNPRATAQGFRVSIGRPGTNYTVTYNASTGQAHVRHETRSFLGMLNRLHHQNGLHHQDGRLNAWGWALALVSLMLLAIGVTGVWLWFVQHRDRLLGAALLGTNLAVSVGLLIALRR